jgi:hypothetical protein
MSATLIIVGLIVAGAAMTVFGLVAALVTRARWIERVPWVICGLALCAFAIFAVGGHARRDARLTAQAFRGAAAHLRSTEASYRKRTGQWQTDPGALSLETGCWGVLVEWVGPAGTSFAGFSGDTEVAILHSAGRYEVVSLDPVRPHSIELSAKRDGSLVVAGHRLGVERPACNV